MSKTQKKKQAAAAALAQQFNEDAMPQMPVLPDPRVKYLWSGDNQVKEFDFSKFIQLWPAYIDSDLTISEGRRIGKEFCCPAPLVGEMSEICQMLRLRHVLEPYKKYPRLFWRLGRIRVQITNPDGTFCHPEIQSKEDLLKKMGTSIGKLNSRVQRLKSQAIEQSAQETVSSPTTTATSTSSTKNQKKGKKKGK